ncbi:MAG: ABC transporter permease [FCB group bacterium]|nr:ABC transporter permease [FCB group bacterium]MBL7029409.1 ABC transporter permease [Candidatus Neomarinimicrobiota bacterium]MBL7123192.1 ABC transporter permease [Candidatus Neomarinimicrobiota bacterium]
MFKNYLKIALKVLRRHKLFTFISLFGISFTLLVLIVVTSFIEHTLGPVTPETRLDRTLSVTMGRLKTEKGGTWNGPIFSPWFFQTYVKSMQTPQIISMSSFHHPTVVYKNKKKHDVDVKYVDSEFWQILNFNFLEGGPFDSRQVEDVAPVVIINESTRDKYFAGSSAVDSTLKLYGQDYRVIGVVENVSLLRIMPYSDVWLPMTHTKLDLHKPTLVGGIPGWYAMLLAADKTDLPKIRREFDQQMKQIEFPEGRFTEIHISAATYAEALTRNVLQSDESSVTPLLSFAIILMTLFLLLPTVNLVNINVSRIMERSSEIGVRKAFGASSWTLVGQFVIENVFITLIGGLISIVLAVVILRLINDSGMIAHLHLVLNFRVFWVSMVIALFFGLLSGVYPAYKMSRMHPVTALRGGQS